MDGTRRRDALAGAGGSSGHQGDAVGHRQPESGHDEVRAEHPGGGKRPRVSVRCGSRGAPAADAGPRQLGEHRRGLPHPPSLGPRGRLPRPLAHRVADRARPAPGARRLGTGRHERHDGAPVPGVRVRHPDPRVRRSRRSGRRRNPSPGNRRRCGLRSRRRADHGVRRGPRASAARHTAIASTTTGAPSCCRATRASRRT